MRSQRVVRAQRIARRFLRYRLHAAVFAALLGLSELLWRWQTWTLRQLLELTLSGRP